MLALTARARRWEPKRLRLRLFSAAGRLVRGGRRLRLRLAADWPWATQITTAITRLQALATRLTSRNRPYRPGKDNPRARGTPPTRRDSRAATHDRTRKSTASRTPQPTTSRSRKIEAKRVS